MDRIAESWGRRALVIGLCLAAPFAGMATALAVTAARPSAAGPAATIVSAKKGAAGVRIAVRVAFPAATTGKACAGALKLSTKGAHGRRVVLRGTASASGGACSATLRGVVPAADYGRRITFTLTLKRSPGGFTRSLNLRVAPHVPAAPKLPGTTTTGTPTTPTAPATTPTTTTPTIPGTSISDVVNGAWSGSVVNLSVSALKITHAVAVSSLNFLNCTPPGGGPVTTSYYLWAFPSPTSISIDPTGAFSGSTHQITDFGNGSSHDAVYTISGQLNVTNLPYTGTVTIGVSGSFVFGGEHAECTASATENIFHQ